MKNWSEKCQETQIVQHRVNYSIIFESFHNWVFQVSPKLFVSQYWWIISDLRNQKKLFHQKISLKIYDFSFIICRNFFVIVFGWVWTANPAKDNNKKLPVIIKIHQTSGVTGLVCLVIVTRTRNMCFLYSLVPSYFSSH